MPAASSPSLLRLAQRLRSLRVRHWPDVRLTQDALARALGGEEPLSAATVSSWESPTSPKLAPRDRMIAYARFFATRRSVEGEPRLVPHRGRESRLRGTRGRAPGAARRGGQAVLGRDGSRQAVLAFLG
jgi:hypothetical protein